MKTKSVITALALSVTILILPSATSVQKGPSCQQTIKTCVNQVNRMSDALTRLNEQCAESGSDGCLTAAQQLKLRLHEAKIRCSEKVREACQ